MRSSLSLPLMLAGNNTFAGSNIYGGVVAAFSDEDEQLSQAFAAQASIVVSNVQAYWAAFELSRNLTRAMEARAVIEQAKAYSCQCIESTLTPPSNCSASVHRPPTASCATSPPTWSTRPCVETPMADDRLEAARRHLGLSYLDVWIDCFALGGNLDAGQLTEYLPGERDVSTVDHNVVVTALTSG